MALTRIIHFHYIDSAFISNPILLGSSSAIHIVVASISHPVLQQILSKTSLLEHRLNPCCAQIFFASLNVRDNLHGRGLIQVSLLLSQHRTACFSSPGLGVIFVGKSLVHPLVTLWLSVIRYIDNQKCFWSYKVLHLSNISTIGY